MRSRSEFFLVGFFVFVTRIIGIVDRNENEKAHRYQCSTYDGGNAG